MHRFPSLVLGVGFVLFQLTLHASTNWFSDAVWYQIFPERFRNGDASNDPLAASLEGTWPYFVPTGWKIVPWTSDWYQLQPWERDGRGFYTHAQLRRYGGDIQGILDKLDYLQTLGVNALYLNPVFDSASLHKYGATMYHHIDRHFGPDPEGDSRIIAAEDAADPATWRWTAADQLFVKLIREVHRRDMRIIIDGVFNHVGIPFWALQRAKREGPASRFANWFEIKRWDDPATPADEFEYQGWAGVKDLPQLARDGLNLHPDIREHLHAVVRRWMDPNGDGNPSDGIDGWRLDVAAEMPMGFWKEFRGWVKTINPDAYLTGEIWCDDYQANTFRNARPWLDQAFDGVMNYRFGDAVFEFFNRSNGISPSRFGELLTRIHGDYGYERCLELQNLFDSHDTARIGSAVVNRQYRQDHAANLADNRTYDVRAPNAAEKQRWKQMVAFQFLSPGAPYIYSGDEVGMWGADDPDCRKPMVWSDLRHQPERAHPFGDPRKTNPVKVDRDLFAFHREWIARRHKLPVLRQGSFKIVLADDSARVFAFRRELDHHSVIALFNTGDRDVHVSFEKLDLNGDEKWLNGTFRVHHKARVPAGWFTVLENVSPK
ncbi:MAG: glycoside hydrolase family 13 protein [Pedosphaera sp.]|nr:glycoside hydrolase family 13 protein [Pedosphaera sp.]